MHVNMFPSRGDASSAEFSLIVDISCVADRETDGAIAISEPSANHLFITHPDICQTRNQIWPLLEIWIDEDAKTFHSRFLI